MAGLVSERSTQLISSVPALDEALRTYAARIGNDFTGYRNHVYRVANFCTALAPTTAESPEKIAIATAFHDIGIWTDVTFDYRGPSVREATTYLTRLGKTAWIEEIRRMIEQHHKITQVRENPDWLVEPFRRADWIDVSLGLVTFGLPRKLIRDAYSMWPSAGFHRRLVQLSLKRLMTHPASPLPMLKL